MSLTTTVQPAVLECRELHRYLGRDEGRVHALRGVSLGVEAGRSYAIAGPSGCGKSTLLYTLGLLDRPDAGEVCVAEEELSRAGDERRTRTRLERIGFVFQYHFLLTEFSALENVMLPMWRAGRMTREGIRERAIALLGEVGLEGKGDRLANHLSGGEQQRVAIARALANSPAVVLADEPTGNLDAPNAARVAELLVGLAKEKGRAVVIVTHNPEIARRCDMQLTMEDGRFR